MNFLRYDVLAFAPAGSSIALAEALEIPWSGRRPCEGGQRPEMEASLAQRGVTW